MYELQRDSAEYLARVDEFIKFAESYRVKTEDVDILCPCKDCKNFKRFGDWEEIRAHLICREFQKRYTCWFMHGEKIGECSGANRNSVLEETYDNVRTGYSFEIDSNDDFENVENFDNVHELDCNEDDCENIDENAEFDCIENLEDMLRDVEDEISDKNYKKFQYMSSESKRPLYPGCTKFTKLSAVLKLLNLKADNGWSDKSFTSLLELLRKMLPDNNELPCTIYQAKKLICPMGLKIEKIHACPNDCVLYRGEYEVMHVCPKCGVSRYKRKDQDTDDGNNKGKKGRAPAKAVWYFLIIPRFKWLFANPKDAKLLHWHGE